LRRERAHATLRWKSLNPFEVFVLTGVGRVLTLTCCVLLTLPPGWCCEVAAGQCCGPTLPPTTTAPAVEYCTSKACSGTTCAHGCCSKEPASQHETPAPTPQKPSRPCDTTCCEHPPIAAPKVERPVIDLGAIGIQDVYSVTAPGRAITIPVDEPPRSAFPPLHILHCVWLC
jgi:hypothetical protein